MFKITKSKVELAIRSKFEVGESFKIEKDGGHWWFVVDSDLEFGSVYLLTSFTALWQTSIDGWLTEFNRCYTRHFGYTPKNIR